MTIIWVALAGAAGACARFTADGIIRQSWTSKFPLATLIVNISGSLTLGFFTGLVLYHGVTSSLTLIAGTGFCGGYTTFSTASFESVRLIQRREFLSATINVMGTVVLTMVAVAAGLELAQL